MPCFSPLKALRTSGGVQILRSDAKLFNLQIPCGQCVGCRLERSRQWAMRCVHEASLYEHNCFLTLTYDDEHVPHDGGLHYSHFQKFLKRLRRSNPDVNIRFYMCGEYGGKFGRPHFHACIFNFTFSDLELWRKSNSGFHLYRSAKLEQLWPFGFSSVGALTFESAAYCARYIMKKVTGDLATRNYESVSTVTGEIYERCPEFNKMSLKPGIGAGWYEKFNKDVFPHDRVVINGTPSKPPRYYDKLYSRDDIDAFNDVKSKRVVDIASKYKDNNPSRLNAKRLVTEATLSKLKRSLTS